MSDTNLSSAEVSLWDCLHDGSLQSLTSDKLARSVTVVIDVPYLWSFHSLPQETKFRLVLDGVREVEILQFKPWPGDFVIPEGLPWPESQKLRQDNYLKGRLESGDWQTLAAKLENTERYEISNAAVTVRDGGTALLTFQLMDDDGTDFPEVRITAKRLRFFLGEGQELSLQDFLRFGEAYWQAFAQRQPANASGS